MKITKIEVALGRTLNLGNYESANIRVAMEATFDDGAKNEDYEKLRGLVEEKLKSQVERTLP